MEIVTASELAEYFERLQGSVEALGCSLRPLGEVGQGKQYLNRDAAAEYLGLSPRMISRLSSEGKLAFVKYGDGNSSPVRFRREDLDAYAEGCRVPTIVECMESMGSGM